MLEQKRGIDESYLASAKVEVLYVHEVRSGQLLRLGRDHFSQGIDRQGVL